MDKKDDRQEHEPIKVTDRRKFTDTGAPRDAASEPEDGDASPAAGLAAGEEQPGGEAFDLGGKAHELPPIDFVSFLLSLSTMALVYMGAGAHPESGKTERNMALAKQHIDILGIMREKTSGNLTPEEDRLLNDLLYELRMKYVSLSK